MKVQIKWWPVLPQGLCSCNLPPQFQAGQTPPSPFRPWQSWNDYDFKSNSKLILGYWWPYVLPHSCINSRTIYSNILTRRPVILNSALWSLSTLWQMMMGPTWSCSCRQHRWGCSGSQEQDPLLRFAWPSGIVTIRFCWGFGCWHYHKDLDGNDDQADEVNNI